MDDKDRCSICLEDFDETKEEYKLSCNHNYHKECIQMWLRTRTTCPLCRAHVDPIQQYVDDDIVTPERLTDIRLEIERMKLFAKIGGYGVEIIGEVLMPNSFRKGFGTQFSQTIERGGFDSMYEGVARHHQEHSWWFVAASVLITAVLYNIGRRN